jgi:folate-binding protein YgfZ
MQNFSGQCEALTEACGVTQLPLSIVRVTGNDRAKFVNNFCTADIKKLLTDHCCEAFFLNTKGKTICHGIVLCREIDILIVTTAASPSVLMENLDRYLLSEDVQLSDVSSTWRCVFVCGDKSEAILEACAIRVPVGQAIANSGFRIVLRAELAGAGILILEPSEGDVDVISALVKAGALECSMESLHEVRILKQTPWCDSEVTDACLPQEFRRDSKAISFTKGCYLGQETVARLDALGHVNRYLTGYEIVAGEVEVDTELKKDGKKIGRISSLGNTDSEGDRKALGFIRVEHSKPGEVIECEDVTVKIV